MNTDQLNPLSSFYLSATVEMARTNLIKTYHLAGETDAQLIRAALNRLAQKDTIYYYSDLVLLRWVTILIDYFPADHPEFGELYKRWYAVKLKAREVV